MGESIIKRISANNVIPSIKSGTTEWEFATSQGWSGNTWDYCSGTIANNLMTMNTGYHPTSGSGSPGLFTTTNQINLTGVNFIYITFSEITNAEIGHCGLGISSTKYTTPLPDLEPILKSVVISTDAHTSLLDVSNISGSYYIYWYAYSQANTYCTFKVTDIFSA